MRPGMPGLRAPGSPDREVREHALEELRISPWYREELPELPARLRIRVVG